MRTLDARFFNMHLTMVALVSLVAIIGVVALVLNSGGAARSVASPVVIPIDGANALGEARGIDCNWVMANPDSFRGTRTWTLCGLDDVW